MDAASLIVVLEAARPLAGSLRVRLDDIDEVQIGRGPERAATRSERVLELRVPDRRMSVTHARLRRKPDAGWELEDAGSKNGSRVGGEMRARAPLGDGVVIELGQTTLILRTTWPAAGPAVIEDATLAPVAGITTLVPWLAARAEELHRLAPTGEPIVLGGEPGTGKEQVARAIHAASGRAELVLLASAQLPHGTIEPDRFGAPAGGTLAIDELAELQPPAQAALLRLLDERPDVRVIAATQRDVPALVEGGRFRADLWARLSANVARLPPLRERREDLGVLVAALLRRHAGERAPGVTLTAEAAHLLITALWPRNLRTLDHALAAALRRAGDAPVDIEHLRDVHEAPNTPTPDDGDLRALLVALLTEHHGNVAQVARVMGKARTQVQRWMQRYALDAGTFRA